MSRSFALRVVSALIPAAALVACGPAPDGPGLDAPLALSFALPVACAQPPADLEAVAWVSGSRDPVPLEVDLAEGTTSGTLRVTTGAERRIVLDWFVERAGTRVLLGQAVTSLDLTAPEAESIVVEIAPSDVEVAACRDVTGDVTRVGSATTTFEGEQRPTCDLDDSCAGGLEAVCSNLGELCAGEDPLR